MFAPSRGGSRPVLQKSIRLKNSPLGHLSQISGPHHSDAKPFPIQIAKWGYLDGTHGKLQMHCNAWTLVMPQLPMQEMPEHWKHQLSVQEAFQLQQDPIPADVD